MIVVSREEFEGLQRAKLIKFNKDEKNFRVTGQKKKSARKKYYVAETKQIKIFLGLIKV